MGSISIEIVFYIVEAIVATSVIVGLFYIWKQTRKNKHQRHIHKVVDSLGVKYLRDIVLPDGVDGLVFIDYLLLVPGGFIVIDTEHSEGHLFGGETVDQWSQVINKKTYKFNNPLYANQSACQAVLWNLQNNTQPDKSESPPVNAEWKIEGWVVFSNAGNFPKGIPSQVSMIDELKNNLVALLSTQNATDENQQKVWDDLHSLSISTQTENKH